MLVREYGGGRGIDHDNRLSRPRIGEVIWVAWRTVRGPGRISERGPWFVLRIGDEEGEGGNQVNEGECTAFYRFCAMGFDVPSRIEFGP